MDYRFSRARHYGPRPRTRDLLGRSEQKESELSRLLLGLKLKRYCCKMRINDWPGVCSNIFQ